MTFHFAPLQGYTEAPYRAAHHQILPGIDAYYTPFIRLEHGKIRNKDLREARPEANQGVNVIPQIIAADRDELLRLTDALQQIGHKAIDINMGCPFPMQTRQGRGSALLLPDNRSKLEAIVGEIQQMTAAGLSISVKMRMGQQSEREGLDVIPMLNACGLSHLTLHPRLGVEQYKGELHTEVLPEYLESLKMPVIYNGEIQTPADIQQILAQYPTLQGVMIGRGLLARPTLVMEYQQGKELTISERRRLVLSLYQATRQRYEQIIEGGEGQLLMKLQTFWEYLEPTFDHKSLKKVLKAGNLRNYDAAVAALPR